MGRVEGQESRERTGRAVEGERTGRTWRKRARGKRRRGIKQNVCRLFPSSGEMTFGRQGKENTGKEMNLTTLNSELLIV